MKPGSMWQFYDKDGLHFTRNEAKLGLEPAIAFDPTDKDWYYFDKDRMLVGPFNSVQTAVPALAEYTKSQQNVKEAHILDLVMTLVQSSKNGKPQLYRETRKAIMRLFHGDDQEYKNIIKDVVRSYRAVNDLNIGDEI